MTTGIFGNSIRLLTLSLVLCGQNGSAQSPDTLWRRTFGGTNIDVGYAVQQTTDGGYVVAGYTRSFGTTSGRNVLLLKTDPSGMQSWIRGFGGNSDDEGASVQQTSDGGYIIAGYTKSSGAGASDVYLVKTDSSGNLSWTRTFGGSLDEEAYGVRQTTDGGYIVAGATSSFGAGSRDVWLVKTDASGAEAWRKTLGGMSSDGARSIQQTADGGFIITGWTYSYGPAAVGNVWLVKTDSAGNIVWHRAFGGTDADRGLFVQQTGDGGYVLTGYTASSGAGLDDMLLIRTDSAGDSLWMRTYGGSGRDYGNGVRQTVDGGFIVAGYTLSFGSGGDDLWVVRTDSTGEQIWSAAYGGSASDVGNSIALTGDGGAIITGHTLSYGAGVHDVWLLKLAPEVTAVDQDPVTPGELRLEQNYPNPFNPATTLRFTLASRQSTIVTVYDILGKEVAVLVNEVKDPGTYTLRWDAAELPGGVYFCRMMAGGFTRTRPMLLLK